MKLRTTTPVSTTRLSRRAHSRVSRSKKVFRFTAASLIAVAMVASSLPLINKPVSADQYDDKIAQLTRDMQKYQAQADSLNAQAATLQNAIAQLDNEKNALQSQIDLNQTQHDQLVIQIADTEKQIKENQDALGKTIADLYIDDSTSPIELLASSTNIGDFLNKQEYRSSVKTQLNDTIKKVKTLKVQLDKQKTDLDSVLAQQKDARDQLVAKQNEQNALLAQTKSDESSYQNLIKDSKSQIEAARATQAAISARYNRGGAVVVNVGGSDYPWNNANCPMQSYFSTGGADGNGGDGWGYGCRQCASYVAWKIYKETGSWKRWGNAVDFTSSAKAEGYKDLGMSPEPGSIAVMDPAKAGQSFGHVAWVEAAYGDRVVVSQYNANINGIGYGMFTKVEVSKYSFDHYVKIK